MNTLNTIPKNSPVASNQSSRAGNPFLHSTDCTPFFVASSIVNRNENAALQGNTGKDVMGQHPAGKTGVKDFFSPFIQAKLTINAPGDQYEQEADAMADKIMAGTVQPATQLSRQASVISPLQRKCAQCDAEEKDDGHVRVKSTGEIIPLQAGVTVSRKCASCDQEEIQRKKSPSSPTSVPNDAAGYISRLPGKGVPLSRVDQHFYSSNFRYDFSGVRIHSDHTANRSAADLNALAYTHGNNIVFGANQYQPETNSGKKLLAHELTHVVQQSGGKANDAVQCDLIDDLKREAEKKAEEFATAKLNALGAEPVGAPSGFTGEQPKCGPHFCQPFASQSAAIADLAWAGPLILAGIAKKVNTRVVPLWAAYLAGGSSVKNLTPDFGADFTASPTTATTTAFLVGELKKDIVTNQVALMGGGSTATIDFTPRLSTALAAIDDPAKPVPPQMNFGVPSDIAGNVAGGIGKDETSFPIGAKPSPFNDSREATVKAILIRNIDGSITVFPSIRYIVKDTIDLCPGDCGTSREMVATVPLSRFEATGLSGDVPLTVEFDAPALSVLPFIIPPVVPPVSVPVPGKVTASVLNIRSTPDTAAANVGSYKKGDSIMVICQTTGTIVDGINTWYQTDKGFVSGRYITLSGGGVPAAC